MEKNLIQYIKDGITIDKLPNGKYSVFTIQTQRFTINSLEELTPQSFEDAIKRYQEKEELQKQAMTKFQDEITTKKIEGIPVDKISFDYFKSIVEQPPKSEFKVMNGENIPVGDKYLLKFNNDMEYEVYIHSVYFNSKKNPDINEVGFIIIETGRLEIISIWQIKKTIKEISLI